MLEYFKDAIIDRLGSSYYCQVTCDEYNNVLGCIYSCWIFKDKSYKGLICFYKNNLTIEIVYHRDIYDTQKYCHYFSYDELDIDSIIQMLNKH